MYDFDATLGAVAIERFFEKWDIAGSIGFSWGKNTDTLFVSNFNLSGDKRDNSLTVLFEDGVRIVKIANFGTDEGADIDKACWTLNSADGSKWKSSLTWQQSGYAWQYLQVTIDF